MADRGAFESAEFRRSAPQRWLCRGRWLHSVGRQAGFLACRLRDSAPRRTFRDMWVWVGGTDPLFPTPIAGIDWESTDARDQSIWSVQPSWSRRTWWSFCQTPASCQSRNRGQQIMPQPQFISWGSIFQRTKAFGNEKNAGQRRTVANVGASAFGPQ